MIVRDRIIPLALALVALCACHGGGPASVEATSSRSSGASPSPSTSAAPAVSAAHTEWARRATIVCTHGDQVLAPIMGREPTTQEELASSLERIGRTLLAYDAKLRAIEAPGEDASMIREMLVDWDGSARYFISASQEAKAGHADAAQQDLDSSNRLNARGNQIANDLGVPTCADMGSGASSV